MIEQIGKEVVAKRFPDRIRLKATRIQSGEQLGRLMEGSNAFHLHYDENIARDAKETAATIFDYLKDYADIDELVSASDKLNIYRELDDYLRNLNESGAIAYAATRTARIVGENWKDKTPLRLNIAYLIVSTTGKIIDEIMASKHINFGF